MTTALSASITPVTAGALTKSLALLTKLTRSRALPVLRGVKVTVADGVTTLEVFDYELAAHVELVGQLTDVAGVYLVDATDLHAFVRSLDKPSALVANVTGAHLELRAGGTTCRLELLDLDAYPALPCPAAPRASCDRDAFAALVTRAVVAAGDDDTLPVLTAVQLVFDGDTVTAAATNRYLLAVVEATITRLVDVPRDPVAVLVPASSLSLAVALHTLAGASSVGIGIADQAGEPVVTLRCGSNWLVARTMPGTFPKYQSLFPDAAPVMTISLERKLAFSTVGQLFAAAGWTANARRGWVMRVDPYDDRLELTALSTDYTTRASATLPATVTGEPFVFACDPRYLRAIAVAYSPARTVDLSLVQAHKPLVLTAADAPGVRMLMMPIKLPAG